MLCYLSHASKTGEDEADSRKGATLLTLAD